MPLNKNYLHTVIKQQKCESGAGWVCWGRKPGVHQSALSQPLSFEKEDMQTCLCKNNCSNNRLPDLINALPSLNCLLR
jgi:hypothetical protein